MSTLDLAGVPPGGQLVRGSLPSWGPRAIYAGAAMIALGLLALTDISPALLVVGAVAICGVGVYAWSRVVEGVRAATDHGITFLVSTAFALAIAPLVSVAYTVIEKGSARFDYAFFTESARNVVGAGGGASHAIVGTLLITGCATLASVPIGILAAVYLQEYGHGRLKRAITFFVDVMTGIPSIVAGLFAYALFALFLGPGIRLGVMGSVALSVLMIPIVVRSTEEMLKIVPDHLREASAALGVPKWRTVVKVVLPTALGGIISGVMLAIARVMGETAPLLITTGVFSSTNLNAFDGRMQNLAVYAFNEYKSPGVPNDPYFERAWAAALTLILLVMTLSLLARVINRRFGTEQR
ncbi:MAG: phosphate ABC transporter permease PstA [Solirubrobacteraceae bacterium]